MTLSATRGVILITVHKAAVCLLCLLLLLLLLLL